MSERIDLTILPNGKVVSTVFLKIDGFFETMVFPDQDTFSELYCERYFTEDEARSGHARIVAEYSSEAV